MFPEAFLRRRRREPFDERLPDGRSVYEAVAGLDERVPYADAALSQTRNPQVLTPQDQQTITRPRIITPQEQQSSPFIDAFTRSRGTETRDRRTEPRDYMADDAAYVRDLNKQGRTWRDKIVDVTDALNAVAGGPKRVLPTKRERELMRAQGNLEQDFEVQKQEMNQMVPVTLEDGTQVMVPRRTAGALQGKQQEYALRKAANEERKRMNTARINNWNSMSEGRRQRLIADLYKSGGMNDPDLLEYAADQLGIPGTLREKFIAGQMRDAIDADGNLVQINRQTQEVLPTGQKSFEVTKEANRNRRFSEGQAGADRRAGMRGTGTGAAPKPDRAAERKAANLIGVIERARREMETIDQTNGDKARREQVRLAGEQAAAELNALNAGYEAGPGEKGYPYYKQRGAQAASPTTSGRTIEGAVEAFTRKVGRAPNADEIARMKAALGQQ